MSHGGVCRIDHREEGAIIDLSVDQVAKLIHPLWKWLVVDSKRRVRSHSPPHIFCSFSYFILVFPSHNYYSLCSKQGFVHRMNVHFLTAQSVRRPTVLSWDSVQKRRIRHCSDRALVYWCGQSKQPLWSETKPNSVCTQRVQTHALTEKARHKHGVDTKTHGWYQSRVGESCSLSVLVASTRHFLVTLLLLLLLFFDPFHDVFRRFGIFSAKIYLSDIPIISS